MQSIVINNLTNDTLLITRVLNEAAVQPFTGTSHPNRSSTPIIPQITEGRCTNDLSKIPPCPLLLDLPSELKRPLLLSVGKIEEIVRLRLVCADFNKILKEVCEPFLKCQSNLLKGIYLLSEDELPLALDLRNMFSFCFADEKLVLGNHKEAIRIWDIRPLA